MSKNFVANYFASLYFYLFSRKFFTCMIAMYISAVKSEASFIQIFSPKASFLSFSDRGARRQNEQLCHESDFLLQVVVARDPWGSRNAVR